MKRWFLFVVSLGVSSFLVASNCNAAQLSASSFHSAIQLPKLVVEEVQMGASQEAPVHTYDLSYTVDAASATFTLTSSNYAINKLGIKLISQKTGEVTPSLDSSNDKEIQLDLSRLPKGTYYLRLCQSSGDIVKIYRLIKAQ